MSEWDFLWGLEGQELIDALTAGSTYDDWAYIEEMDDTLLHNAEIDYSDILLYESSK